jgi:outer membrane protein assembly factor BamB
MYIISLIDCTILYEHGNADPLSLRYDWSAFDSSPLVHKETDTLIWPGENGILYTYQLNTQYDQAAGTISVSPSNMVIARYSSDRSRSGRYLGYEASASVVDHYLYISENGGLFFCVDLNTMEPVWVQDTLDDSNSSPVFEWNADGSGAIYTAPSLHWTAYASAGTVSIYKLDAATGDILWTHEVECTRDQNISGGVQCTPVLGKDGTALEDMVIYTIASTPSFYKGVLTALNRETGEVIWEVSTGNYAWSSPVPLYAENGKAYLLFANASGYVHLIDGATGESVDSVKLTGTIEASPVVYGNYIVLGTRERVYGLKIS